MEIIGISNIKLNSDNPRSITDEKFNKLVQSIKEFSQMLEIRPIVINDEGMVLGGNMRLKACQEAGIRTWASMEPVIIPEQYLKQRENSEQPELETV